MSEPLLRMDSVKKVFYTDEVETHALSGIHIEINKGEFVSIAGPSGCGKSTLLSILGLLDSPSEGEYLPNNKPVQDLSMSDRARIRNQDIGFVFQNFNLIGDMTVYENIEQPLTYSKMRPTDLKERVNEALAKLGLTDRARQRPASPHSHAALISLASALVCAIQTGSRSSFSSRLMSRK